jgi:hypothetical protein
MESYGHWLARMDVVGPVLSFLEVVGHEDQDHGHLVVGEA